MRFQHVLISTVPALSLGALIWLFLQPDGSTASPAPPAAAAVRAVEPATPPQEKKSSSRLPEEVWDRFRPVGFKEIFQTPVGDYGLEFQPEFTALAGKEVRFTGHMVQHAHEDHSVFLLTPQPMRLNMAEYGLADDLPPWAMHVILPEESGSAPAWTGVPLAVCGVLEIGNRQEKDGRLSPMRLIASHVVDPLTLDRIGLMKPLVLQKDRLRSLPPPAR